MNLSAVSSSSSSSLLFTLCLILISHSPLAANAEGSGNKFVDTVCNETLQYSACISEIGSNHEILKAQNYLQLSRAILEFAINKGTKGQNFLKGLLASNNSPALSQCANFDYDGVVESFRSSLGELKEDPQTANYDAKVAGDGPNQCESGLAEAHIVNPAISSLNKEISLLSLIAFMATNHL